MITYFLLGVLSGFVGGCTTYLIAFCVERRRKAKEEMAAKEFEKTWFN
jgi:membrane protein YqaA with SNARE-associated domain